MQIARLNKQAQDTVFHSNLQSLPEKIICRRYRVSPGYARVISEILFGGGHE